mgnify:CR=1 FL=1
MRIYARIDYTVDKKHPDIKYLKDWNQNKIYSFEDVYHFNDEPPTSEIEEYIKDDLMLVAGGGYTAEHIHNVDFTIYKI